MKKSQATLLKLAAKFEKYASIDAVSIADQIKQSIQTAVANASQTPSMGIMPFLKQLETDKASLAINVTRDDDKIIVSSPSVSPMSVAGNYGALTNQIQKYLTKYIELFPSQRNGEKIDYNNLTITLEYPSADSQRFIAQK